MNPVSDPYGWWIEPFVEHAFMRSALVAGLLAVLATSVVGTWVVLRGMTLLGDALAHGVLPGLALAAVVGFNLSVGAALAALAMAAGVSLIRSSSPLPEDTATGVLFVGFLALAVVIMSAGSTAYSTELTSFLFGSITGVTNADLVRQAIATSVTVIGTTIGYRAFLALTFDETNAAMLGLRPRLTHGVLLVLIAVAIVSSFEAVGNLLVFAFLVAPPAAGALVASRVPTIMGVSVALGGVAVVLGLLIGLHFDTAPSATMALLAVFEFAVIAAFQAVAPHSGSPRPSLR